MKIDETALQHILRTYGKPGRPAMAAFQAKESEKHLPEGTLQSERDLRFEAAGYDRAGQLQLDPQKKKALIDFFQ